MVVVVLDVTTSDERDTLEHNDMSDGRGDTQSDVTSRVYA